MDPKPTNIKDLEEQLVAKGVDIDAAAAEQGMERRAYLRWRLWQLHTGRGGPDPRIAPPSGPRRTMPQ